MGSTIQGIYQKLHFGRLVVVEELDLEAPGFSSRPSEADLVVGEEAEHRPGEAEAVGDQAEGCDQL